jgi:hypothetical protein
MTHAPLTIVGFGVAGQFLLSHIIQVVPESSIAIIDPDFIGGELQRHYHSINSNTTVQQGIDALSTLPPIWSQACRSLEKYNTTSTVSLGLLASELHAIGRSLTSKCRCIYSTLKKAQWDTERAHWILSLATGVSFTTDVLCLCTGIVPRQEDYGIPTIPLYKALDSHALQRILRKDDKVVVLGSSHSATLVLKHLNAIPDIDTICLYKSPFKYARDGHPSGIKEESAKIADSIQAGEYTRLTMIPCTNLHLASKAFRSASWIIQATGFHSSLPEFLDASGTPIQQKWDSVTGKSLTMESVHAFGACVTNEQGDVGLGAFTDQLQTRLPPLLERLKSI